MKHLGWIALTLLIVAAPASAGDYYLDFFVAAGETDDTDFAVLGTSRIETEFDSTFGYGVTFGYAFDNNVQENPTRTLGYWKNHPDATKMFLPLGEFCGEQIDEHCDAYDFLSLGGGGLNNFKRQAVAALFNCAAWGCTDAVADLIQAGSDACAANDPSFDYGNAGEVLDIFNNSGDDLPLGFNGGRAKPKYCKNGNKNVKDRLDLSSPTSDPISDTSTSTSTRPRRTKTTSI